MEEGVSLSLGVSEKKTGLFKLGLSRACGLGMFGLRILDSALGLFPPFECETSQVEVETIICVSAYFQGGASTEP